MHNGPDTANNATPEIVALGYETRDVHIPALLWNIGAMWVVLAGVMVFVVWMMGYLKAEKAKTDAAISVANPMAESRHLPPGPLLQIDEAADLKKMHEHEDKILNGFGWVERRPKHQGVAHIPIAQAIDLVADKAAKTGVLPYWPLPAAAGQKPTPAPSASNGAERTGP